MNCRIKIIKEAVGVYPQYQPKVGRVYDAEYIDASKNYRKYPPVCILNIAGKRIIMRKGEFEIVGGIPNG